MNGTNGRKAAVAAAMLLAVSLLAGCARHDTRHSPGTAAPPTHGAPHGAMTGPDGVFMPQVVGEVDIAANGFDPMKILEDFDYGTVSSLPDGRPLREYWITAAVHDVEIVPGIVYQAWTYNGRVPGPTLRATQGDRLRIHFHNATRHPHTMHFHTVHPAGMDGVYEAVAPGGDFLYEFDATPFGVHPYHCHVMPLASHISRGLYGAIIIDPPGGRPPADREMVMVMAGNDIDFDNENDFYNVNFIPFYYDRHPIVVKKDALVRIYLVNMLEFDMSNSFHIHANFFDYYPTGTSREPAEHTDTIAQMQAQRGILEFRYREPGRYMFHAHKTEFAELGWTGVFQVEE
jgi:FtsP/CotA-like multicopper oxidase with cupredoxin domain